MILWLADAPTFSKGALSGCAYYGGSSAGWAEVAPPYSVKWHVFHLESVRHVSSVDDDA